MTAASSSSSSSTTEPLMPQMQNLLQYYQHQQMSSTTSRIRLALFVIAVLCVVSQISSLVRINLTVHCIDCDITGTHITHSRQETEADLAQVELLEELQDHLDVHKEEDYQAEVELLNEEGAFEGDEKTDEFDSDNNAEDDTDAGTEEETDSSLEEEAQEEKQLAMTKRIHSLEEGGSTTTTIAEGDSGPALDIKSTNIRSWGCALNSTPFIFVHIGKAGGGGVRSRLAAAALDYNRSGWHRTHEDDTYYYPVYDNSNNNKLHKAKFASSKMSNMIPPSMTEYEADFAYEGFGPCAATTPLGQAIACPIESTTYCQDYDQDGISQARCDLVYTGHNLLGTELHWLPTAMLLDWWQSTPWFTGSANNDKMFQAIQQRHNATDVCSEGPYRYRQFKSQYQKCFQPKEKVIDTLAKDAVGGYKSNYNLQWARVMASLPTVRVTVLREPFSWLTSKFFWHSRFYSRNGEIVRGHISAGKDKKRADMDVKENKEPVAKVITCDDVDEMAYGWASLRAITYMLYLCGEHCMGGLADGSLTVSDMEQQAAYNLRNSFAVVGILQKTDDFYDMVTKRVYYMDTYLNPEVEGKSHSSGKEEEMIRCKEVYKDPEFQKKVMDKSPAVAALYRLYQVAIEVNEFQSQELAQCPLLNDSSGSAVAVAEEQ